MEDSWSIVDNSLGTVDDLGLFTAPPVIENSLGVGLHQPG